MSYKAIGFDLFGVLRGPSSTEFNHTMATHFGVDATAFETAYQTHSQPVNRGDISVQEFWQRVTTALDRLDRLPALQPLIDDFVQRGQAVNPATITIIDELRVLGWPLGLLSNATAEVADEISAAGIAQRFDVVHISALTGLVKPQPAAFSKLANDLHVQLNELIFIDDSPPSLSSAAECGYQPVLFKDTAGLRNDLHQLGVLD